MPTMSDPYPYRNYSTLSSGYDNYNREKLISIYSATTSKNYVIRVRTRNGVNLRYLTEEFTFEFVSEIPSLIGSIGSSSIISINNSNNIKVEEKKSNNKLLLI